MRPGKTDIQTSGFLNGFISAFAEQQSSRQFYCKVNLPDGPATPADHSRSRLRRKGLTSLGHVDLSGDSDRSGCGDLTARWQNVGSD